MLDQFDIADFLEPIDTRNFAGDESYKPDQMGNTMRLYEEGFPDLEGVDFVIVGCNEQRGGGVLAPQLHAPDAIRRHFYGMYYWHKDVTLADIGNVRPGASYADTLAALKTVVTELVQQGKTVIVLGGTHDLTLGQYGAYVSAQKLIDVACVDALIDLDMSTPFRADNFLMEMLTSEPNYVRHYNHIGFQSYLVHPGMLQTLDKLKFDFFRTGHVKENIEEMEPAIRNSSLFSFDINAIANAYAPCNTITPNGFTGEEACILMQYAGLSDKMSSIGIYGYEPANDRDELTAKQISHMLWYAIDGRSRLKKEADLLDRENFNEFQVMFAEIETVFLQSKKTGRWWMQLPDGKFTPCSYQDYQVAAKDEIPNRWFREQQRQMDVVLRTATGKGQ
ncbi:MAG: formimidoylglutamase [Niabella sp.]